MLVYLKNEMGIQTNHNNYIAAKHCEKMVLNKVIVIACQCRDFLTELCCNRSVFNIFVLGSLLHFQFLM